MKKKQETHYAKLNINIFIRKVAYILSQTLKDITGDMLSYAANTIKNKKDVKFMCKQISNFRFLVDLYAQVFFIIGNMLD